MNKYDYLKPYLLILDLLSKTKSKKKEALEEQTKKSEKLKRLQEGAKKNRDEAK